MKTALYTLTLPVLWFLQITLLIALVVVHVTAAPVRAFVYWGRDLKQRPGWDGFFSGDNSGIGMFAAMGIGIPKEENDGRRQSGQAQTGS